MMKQIATPQQSQTRILSGWIGMAAALCLAATPARATSPIPGLHTETKVIVTSGDPAPDGNGRFVGFDAPLLNSSGTVAFRASLSGGGINSDQGIFRGDGTTLLQIARESQVVPGGNGVYSSFGFPTINESGQVAFGAFLRMTNSPNTDTAAIYRGTGVEVVEIVRAGQTLPDGVGIFRDNSFLIDQPLINNVGQVAFSSSISGAAPSSGIFRGDGTTVVQIARRNQPAPDGMGVFYDIDRVPTQNNSGQVTFRIRASDLGASDYGIYRSDGSNSVRIVRTGQAAPDGDGSFSGVGAYVAINDSGAVAFFGALSNPTRQGLFLGTESTVLQIAREGQIAPDGNGALRFFGRPALNESGQVVFRATLSGTVGGNNDNQGLFRTDGTALTQIARAGQTAPGGNGTFKFTTSVDSDLMPTINEKGQIAVATQLFETAAGASDNYGIFLFDDSRGLVQVAREGEPFLGSTIRGLEFNPRTSLSIGVSGHERSGFNKTGTTRIAYQFTLADGRSGIAVWMLVPEPAGGALVMIGLFGVGRFCSRRWRAMGRQG
jgi:hypothetical protein